MQQALASDSDLILKLDNCAKCICFFKFCSIKKVFGSIFYKVFEQFFLKAIINC